MTFARVLILAGILILSACSIQEFAERTVPAHILEHSQKSVDAIMAGDPEFFEFIKEKQKSPEKFEELFFEATAYKSDGAELSRNIVSFETSSSISTQQGKLRNINISYELETEGGFTLIALSYGLNPETSQCCVLYNLNVSGYESSPVLATMQALSKIAKIAGVVFLIVLVGVIVFLIRHFRRRRARSIKSEEEK